MSIHSKISNNIKIILVVLLPLIAGFIGSYFTAPAIPGWYANLEKPFFSPPNWVFGPAWTVLYVLMGAAFFLIWREGFRKKEVRIAVYLFCFQLALNVLWSVIFFGLQSPLYAFVEIIVLWTVILITIAKFYPVSKKAAYLMIPYILWVSFATFLNYAVLMLNL